MTRKITRAATRIKVGLQDKLLLPQVKEMLKKLPDGMTFELSLEKDDT